MTTIQLPGLAGEITQYLDEQSPISSPRMAMGGSIALLGAIVSTGWELPHITPYPVPSILKVLPDIDIEDIPTTQPLGLSVMLVSKPGHGKGCIIEGLELLLDRIPTVRQRLRTIQHMNHLALAGMEPGAESGLRRKGCISPTTYEKLSEGSCFLLTESTTEAFQHQLPHWYGDSELYGGLLVIQHLGPKVRKSISPQLLPPTGLLERLNQLIKAPGEHKKRIEVTADAVNCYRQFWRYDMDAYCDHGPIGLEGAWARQSLQIAAILAVGINPLHPVVTTDLFRFSGDSASEGVRKAREGLVSAAGVDA